MTILERLIIDSFASRESNNSNFSSTRDSAARGTLVAEIPVSLACAAFVVQNSQNWEGLMNLARLNFHAV